MYLMASSDWVTSMKAITVDINISNFLFQLFHTEIWQMSVYLVSYENYFFLH